VRHPKPRLPRRAKARKRRNGSPSCPRISASCRASRTRQQPQGPHHPPRLPVARRSRSAAPPAHRRQRHLQPQQVQGRALPPRRRPLPWPPRPSVRSNPARPPRRWLQPVLRHPSRLWRAPPSRPCQRPPPRHHRPLLPTRPPLAPSRAHPHSRPPIQRLPQAAHLQSQPLLHLRAPPPRHPLPSQRSRPSSLHHQRAIAPGRPAGEPGRSGCRWWLAGVAGRLGVLPSAPTQEIIPGRQFVP
jgi:hypothetical protein